MAEENDIKILQAQIIEVLREIGMQASGDFAKMQEKVDNIDRKFASAQNKKSERISTSADTSKTEQLVRQLRTDINYAKAFRESPIAKEFRGLDRIFKAFGGDLKNIGLGQGKVFGSAMRGILAGGSGVSSIGHASRLAGAGGLGAAGAFASAGLAAGLLAVGYAIKTGVDQVGKLLKENLSYGVLAQNFVTAKGISASLGHYASGDNTTTMTQYSVFRNMARRMGFRDDKELTAVALGLSRNAAIAGGQGNADLYQSALDKMAAGKVFGIDIADTVMRQLYRSTRSNAGFLRTEASGSFTVDKFMQGFANLTKLSTQASGAATSMREFYDIFTTIQEQFRGTGNSAEYLQMQLARYGKMISDNKITKDDVIAMYQAPLNMSDSSIFRMLAFGGESGSNLLQGRYDLLQQAHGSNVEGSARTVARGLLGFVQRVGGDSATQHYFLSQEMRRSGLGQVVKDVAPGDLIPFLEKVASGDEEAVRQYKEMSANTHEQLQNTASKLDAIKSPVEHIRDLLFGWAAQTLGLDKAQNYIQTVMEKLYKSDALSVSSTTDYLEQLKQRKLDDDASAEKQVASEKDLTDALKALTGAITVLPILGPGVAYQTYNGIRNQLGKSDEE